MKGQLAERYRTSLKTENYEVLPKGLCADSLQGHHWQILQLIYMPM